MTHLGYFSCLVALVAFFIMALWPYISCVIFKEELSFLFIMCDFYFTTPSLVQEVVDLHLTFLNFFYHSLDVKS